MNTQTELREENCNYLKSLLGIETDDKVSGVLGVTDCNYLKSLLGIETFLPTLLRAAL